eukprot:sb/3477754/
MQRDLLTDDRGVILFRPVITLIQSLPASRSSTLCKDCEVHPSSSNVHPTLTAVVVQSDPDLVIPDLVTPRFSDRINFPRYRKLTVFDPDLVATRFSDQNPFPRGCH